MQSRRAVYTGHNDTFALSWSFSSRCGPLAIRDDRVGLGTSIQRNTCLHAGGANPLAWKVTMSSWFISPWDTVQFSLEAQRLIALQFFPYAPRKAQTHQEERDKKAVVPGLGSSADLPTPPRARETVRARTVAARSTMDVRKATATRKLNSSKRKRKSDKQRG